MIDLFALIVPFKFKVPSEFVIVPKLFVPYTFNVPLLEISPLLVNKVLTVVSFVLVNTLSAFSVMLD